MVRNIIYGPEAGNWIAKQLGCGFSPATATAIGLGKDGEIVAGVMYENWNKRSITAHMAVVGRLTRGYIGEIFRYAYGHCGVNKVILPVESTNQKSIRFVEHLGFTEECRIKDAAPGADIIIFTLEKAQCRFLGEKYG